MKQLVIGDLHFGKYGNKQEWLNSQIEYFRKDIFSIIKDNLVELTHVIFLGDIFDLRYSTNTQVGCEIKNLFRELHYITNGFCKIVIIAGNHDYYTPLESQMKYNAYEMVFGREFQEVHKNIMIVNEKSYCDNGFLFCPWYDTEDQERFRSLIKLHRPKTIYCHTDILTIDDETTKLIEDNSITLFAGHIHFPQIKELKNSKMYNIGAAMPIDFSDANKVRSIYLCDSGNIVRKYNNFTTLQFKAYYNEQIFKLDETDFINSTTRLYISAKYINTAKYVEQLNYIKTEFSCKYNIKICQVKDDIIIEDCKEANIVTNINNYIDEHIPEHLLEKLNYIKEKIKNKEEA